MPRPCVGRMSPPPYSRKPPPRDGLWTHTRRRVVRLFQQRDGNRKVVPKHCSKEPQRTEMLVKKETAGPRGFWLCCCLYSPILQPRGSQQHAKGSEKPCRQEAPGTCSPASPGPAQPGFRSHPPPFNLNFCFCFFGGLVPGSDKEPAQCVPWRRDAHPLCFSPCPDEDTLLERSPGQWVLYFTQRQPWLLRTVAGNPAQAPPRSPASPQQGLGPGSLGHMHLAFPL